MDMIYTYAKNYVTDDTKRRKASFPNFSFYYDILKIVTSATIAAKRNMYTAERWVYDSFTIGEAIERVGGKIIIEGHEHLKFEKPCVFYSNHMSTLETFFLPCIIQPLKDLTFVTKESILHYPGIGSVFRARDPIGVSRTNPKLDLAKVLDGGKEILKNGRSILIFPQGTRYPHVDSENFTSLAIKLAKKASDDSNEIESERISVPVVPIALKTDLWGTGKIIKDIGKISPEIPVRIRFGAPLEITGNGKKENAMCIDFIRNSMDDFLRDERF